MRALRNRPRAGLKPQAGFAVAMVLALVVVTAALLAGVPPVPDGTVCRMALSATSGRCL